jgi:hypothetical protein
MCVVACFLCMGSVHDGLNFAVSALLKVKTQNVLTELYCLGLCVEGFDSLTPPSQMGHVSPLNPSQTFPPAHTERERGGQAIESRDPGDLERVR